ncbi:MAG: acyltransferase [Mariprofundaceae bacterium]|nr:acyltransferase [Mariprofundaceae bacterium]
MSEEIASPIKQMFASHKMSDVELKYFNLHGATIRGKILVLGQLPYIKNKCGGSLEIGNHTVLNSDNENSNTPVPTPVKFVIGRNASIKIGDHCDLNGVAITAYQLVEIGNRVQIGASGLIADTDFHPIGVVDRQKQMKGEAFSIECVTKKTVKIEDDVWIGYQVMILKGVTIGRGSIVGAGSVVTKDVPAFTVVAGNPARVIKEIDAV